MISLFLRDPLSSCDSREHVSRMTSCRRLASSQSRLSVLWFSLSLLFLSLSSSFTRSLPISRLSSWSLYLFLSREYFWNTQKTTMAHGAAFSRQPACCLFFFFCFCLTPFARALTRERTWKGARISRGSRAESRRVYTCPARALQRWSSHNSRAIFVNRHSLACDQIW